MIVLHAPDVANYEAPKEAASSSQNNLQSKDITLLAVACGFLLVGVVTVIIIVAQRSKLCVSLFLSTSSILLIPSKKSYGLQVVLNRTESNDCRRASPIILNGRIQKRQ